MKKIRNILLILISFGSFSCINESKVKNEQKEELQEVFNLNNDYVSFSNKLNIGDSISFMFNLSGCAWVELIKFDFTKNEKNISTKIYVSGNFIEPNSYSYNINLDTFDLDSLIKYNLLDSLSEVDKKVFDKRILSDCIIVHGNDSIFLFDSLDFARNKFSYRFKNLMSNKFPKVNEFTPIEVPELIEE